MSGNIDANGYHKIQESLEGKIFSRPKKISKIPSNNLLMGEKVSLLYKQPINNQKEIDRILTDKTLTVDERLSSIYVLVVFSENMGNVQRVIIGSPMDVTVDSINQYDIVMQGFAYNKHNQPDNIALFKDVKQTLLGDILEGNILARTNLQDAIKEVDIIVSYLDKASKQTSEYNGLILGICSISQILEFIK